MTRNTFFTALVVPFALVLALSGCNGETPVTDQPPAETPTAPTGEPDGHEHEHAEHGPHGGDLIELGDEAYHAELLHPEKDDDSTTVTVYILDGAAKETVAIAATKITINLRHDGEGEQFQLAAAPEENDPDGRSSRFVLDDAHLAADLQDEHVDAQLVVEIEGKSYRGKIEHSHGHEH